MRFIADFHIHSRFSRATSKEITLINLAKWAKIKGVNVLGTGDFTHPLWFKELKNGLESAESGLYRLKSKTNKSSDDVSFILTSEISCIYSKGGKVRKVHLIVFAPSIEDVEKINTRLERIGNIKSDGRPILGIDAKELLKIILETSPNSFVAPAHIWTPWFAIFGSKSGFDSIEECFEDYAKYIFALETGLSCYDPETEVLTENGWKPVSSIIVSDKICTLNIKNNTIEFQSPTRLFKYDYKGKMYRLKTKRVDLLVTPNHKLLCSHCDFRKPPAFVLKEAEQLINKSKRFKKDGIWTGEEKEYFVIPRVKIKHGSRYYSGDRLKEEKRLPIKPWLKFFGFWMAEGWTTQGKNGDYNVCVCNNDQNILKEIKSILENFGYSVFKGKSNILRVRDFQMYDYLKQFGKSKNKFIPPEVNSLSKELLSVFFDYYIKGDGHVYGRNGKGLSATTISINLRDDLQEIALKMGLSAYYKLHNKKGTIFNSPGYNYQKEYRQSADSWVIYFLRRNIHTVLPSLIKKWGYTEAWIDYSGPVYCVEVPNHVIYIRRNGIPVWCGNSDPKMNWRLSSLDKLSLISNSDLHSLKKMGREANVFEGKSISYQKIAQGLKKIGKDLKLVYTIEFFPEEGKYHYDGHRACGISFFPIQTKRTGGICPVCGKPLTIGVLNRIEELADRPEGQMPTKAIPFKSLVPLEEIIAEVFGVLPGGKKVEKEYMDLIDKLGNEFNILIEASEKDLMTATMPKIAEGILRVRERKVIIEPGYDGVYGKVKIFN